MRTEPIQLIGSAYADKVRAWSSQDVCNWIPTQAEVPGTRTPQRYATAPGLRPYVEVPESEFSGTVVRGLWNCNNKLFAVIGTQLYQISNTGVAIPRGTIPGVQRVKFAHNWINEGNELLIVNGYSGYVYNTVTQDLKKVVDAGYPGAIDVVFIDNYLVQIEPARRFAFNSALADASNYNELDRFTSEVNSDLLVGMAVTNNELVLFSERSSEFFYNSGDDVQPFKSKRIYMNRGCAGRDTINLTDNTVFWLGDDGCFYRLDGYSPVRISTRPVEEAIRGLNWSQAFSFVWNDSGHSVVYWTFPDGHTWGYDASTQKWHRRASRGMSRWRVNCMATWQDKWFAGDFQAKRLWEVDWDYYLEGDQEIERECTSPVTHDNQCRVLMPRLEVIMDVGNPAEDSTVFPPQPVGPSISGQAPDGTVGVAYSFTYTVTPGSSPVMRTTINQGALLPGLNWNNATATISGTPTAAGEIAIRPRATDANGLTAQVNDVISIFPAGMVEGFEDLYWELLTIEDLTTVTDSFTLLGSADVVYDVELKLSGNIEYRVYSDAPVAVDPAYPEIITANSSASATTSIYNIYKLEVSNPPQRYFVNYKPSSEWTTGASTFSDRRLKVVMAGDATVTVTADPVDGRQDPPVPQFVTVEPIAIKVHS